MKQNRIYIILIFVLITGISLLLYPSIKDYRNSMDQLELAASYDEQIAKLDNNTYEKLWDTAEAYNQTLSEDVERFLFTEEDEENYHALLNVSGNGMMSYIEIPNLSCVLPIYHGTSEEVLQSAVGHVQGSSLPVGGSSSHCVLSGHRGLPNAKLFSDLDQLREGDVFMIHTLDTTLTYEVDQIHIILPHEIHDIDIVKDEDLCTLVTCTPYGENSHRLLVRGHRIENIENVYDVRIIADAVQVEPEIVAWVLAVSALLLIGLGAMICERKYR